MLSDQLRRRVAVATAAALALPATVILATATPAAAVGPGITVGKAADISVLVGTPISYSVTVANPVQAGAVPEYNLSVRDVLPAGVSYVAGSTTPTSAGEPRNLTDGTGRTVLIWDNVADVQVGGSYGISFKALPDPTALPPGSSLNNVGDGYVNINPRRVASFTAVGAPIAGSYTQTASSAPAGTLIIPIEVTKAEPSSEGELMRGVHDNTTVYTLTVTNSGQAPTNGVVVVDYVPANLEFLGCGGVDNSAGREYTGAPSLTGTPVIPLAQCPTPVSVATVLDPAGQPAGVYTAVTWNLGAFASGRIQTIKYAAGIPLQANTMTFTGGPPSPISLQQAANLNNNNGASTRETTVAQAVTNNVVVSGTYTGPMAAGANPAIVATTSLTRTAEDLAVAKSVAPASFVGGAIAAYSLLIRGSEYVSSAGVIATDRIPNGLCPLDASANYANNSPTECDPGAFAPTATVSSPDHGTSSIPILFSNVAANADGSFDVTFSPVALPKDGIVTVTYKARMRSSYVDGDPTASGDDYTNKVAITGTSAPIPNTPESGPQTVGDASSATIASDSPSIDKTVMGNTITPYTCDQGPYTKSVDLPAAQTLFHKGDRACFQLQVNFSNSNNTRNPLVTDFLPAGASYEAGSAVLAPGNTLPASQVSFNESAAAAGTANPTWTLGALQGGQNYVDAGKVFIVRLSVIFTDTPAVNTPDVTGNLMKLRAENTAGVAFSFRDREVLSVAPSPVVALKKGVYQVDGLPAAGNGPDVDNVVVQQGDTVRFRVDLSNNGTAANGNQQPVVAPDVWDVLPTGVTCAQIPAVGISDGGLCTNPGDAGQPTFASAATNSAVRWHLPASYAIASGSAATVFYNMSIPDPTSVSANLVNTASISSFQAAPNVSGESTTFYPAANVDTTVPSTSWDAPAATNTSNVRVADVAVTKTQITSITEAGNNQPTQAVIGELVTYTLTATVPAQSTVYNGVLTDALPAGITLVAGTVSAGYSATGTLPATDPLPAGVTLTGTTLTLPQTYDNNSTSPRLFRLTFTGLVTTIGSNINGVNRVNTASFLSQTAATGGTNQAPRTATSNTTVVEPSLSLSKSASPNTGLVAGQTVTYTLTAKNANGRPPSHDSWVVDCLPAGLVFGSYGATTPSGLATLAAVAGDGSNGCATGTTRLAWNIGDLAGGATATLSYTASVSTTAAGAASYTNTATLTGSSLNDGKASPTDPNNPNERAYSATANYTINVAPAGITKTADSPVHTIGDTATYTVTATLPANINFYDASVIDVLPAGLDLSSVNLTSVDCAAPSGCTVAGTQLASDTPTRKIGWFLGDLASSPEIRTVTLVYTAKVADVAGNTRGVVLSNGASVKWNLTNQTDPTSATAVFDKTTGAATANVTIIEPHIVLAKTVDDTTPDPGQTFNYSVTASNAGASNLSTAYHVVVVDTPQVGVVVDPATISDGGTLTGAGANGGGTITWTLSPLTANASKTLTYSAKLAASSSLTAAPLTNSADATYASLPTGGRVYDDVIPATATVTPAFPLITPTKIAVTASPAYIDEPFLWQLNLQNNGAGKAYGVDAVDTVPLNWRYTPGSASVSVNGGAATQIEPVISIDGALHQVLTWTALGDLAPGTSIVITLTTVPENQPPVSVVLAPGVGATILQTNAVSATASDATGASGNFTGPYHAAPGAASTHIDSADLSVDKTVSTPFVAGATGAWTIAVSNLGPDTAVGPATVTDSLPTGLTYLSSVGAGWTCAYDLPSRTVTCTRSIDTLASGSAFPSIVVSASSDPTTAAGTTYTNTATVVDRTYDSTPENNTSTVTATVTTSADLSIVKALSGSMIAGQNATYTLNVTNSGSSIALAPVTMTDTLPSSLTYVSAAGSGWNCSMAVVAGAQQITCTTGTLAVGAAPQIVVVAAVAAAQTAAVSNTATVNSPTTDPIPDNNSSTATNTPSTSADLALEKTHVGTFLAGTTGMYQFRVDNNGPSDAAGPLTITDTLPNGVTGGSITGAADGWSCTYSNVDPQAMTCERPAGLVNEGESIFQLQVTIASTVVGSLHNVAVVSSPTPDPIPANNTGTDDSGVNTKADLALTKIAVDSTVVAGQTASFVLSAQNLGPSNAQAPVTVTDVVPAGLTFGAASAATGSGWTCGYTSAIRTIACTRAALGSGVTAPDITVVLDVDSNAGPASIRNDAIVGSPTTDPDPDNNNAHATVTVADTATLAIEKTHVGTDPVLAGTSTAFTLAVHNNGPSDADNLTVVDSAPAGLTPTAASGTGWTCTVSAPTVTCTRPGLVAGADAPDITVTADVLSAVPDGTTLVNSASARTATTPGTATATADVHVVTSADLSLTKTHLGTNIQAGDVVTYNLIAHNAGPSDALGPITILDQLPVGLTFQAVTGSGWTCTAAAVDTNGQSVSCTLDGTAGMAAHSNALSLTMAVLVDPSVRAATYENTATVTSPTSDPNPENNSAADQVDVGVSADVAIVKTHTGTAHIGDDLTFSLLVSNAGPSTATDLVVADTLPPGLQYVSAVGTGWTCTGPAVECSMPSLAPGAQATITVTATVLAAAYPTVANTATVTTSSPDPTPTNNTSTDTVSVPALVDLTIVKTHVGTFAVGSPGTYHLQVTNNGPTGDPGPISVTDTVPAGLTYLSGGGTGWTCTPNGQDLTCRLPTGLAANATSRVTVTVQIGAKAYPTVTNTAAVASPAEDTDPGNNTSTDVATVTPQISLRLLKTLGSYNATTHLAGWHLVVSNLGPNVMESGLVVVDKLPTGLTFRNATGTGWACAAVTNVVTCVYANALTVGASTAVDLTTTVIAAPGTHITNTASITSGPRHDSNLVDNKSSAVLAISAVEPPGPGPLPHTGADFASWLLLGLMSLTIGVALRFGVAYRRN